MVATAVVAVVLLALVGIAAAVARSPQPARIFPHTAAEMQAWEGKHVTVETGVAPDQRSFTFEVSRTKDGDLCSFLTVTAPPGQQSGGGGGGCGSRTALGFNWGSEGTVQGLTSPDVVVVDIDVPSGRVSVQTKPLPSQFGNRRYYFGIFPPGTRPTEVVGRNADGAVVARHQAAPQ